MPGTLSATYEQTQHWLKNIGIETVSDVNRLLSSGKETDLISISEALHEKEISDIADLISHRRRFVRVVLISGPSSSGKTTFTQRLSTQLRVNGLRPVPISLDNYFVNREHTPLDENGKPDYECLEAIDLEFLQRQVAQMIGGEPVETPLFDFVTGKRSEETLPVHLGPSDVLLWKESTH
jgi:uridine kinase